MIILGVHAGHDCGAAIVQDDKILAAVNEERITRNKLAFGVPVNSIDEAIHCAGVNIEDIDEIAIETIGKPSFLINHGRPWYKKIFLTKGKALMDFHFIKGNKLHYIYGFSAIPLNLFAMTGIPRFLMTDLNAILHIRRKFGFSKKITFVTHHHAHLSSAYFTSGEREVLSVVIEGYDGINSMAVDMIKDGKISYIDASPFPHSPGEFYSLVTRILGYNYILHNGKITGLAAYGDYNRAYHLVEKLMWRENMKIRLSPLVYELSVEYSKTKKIPAYFKGYAPEDLAAAFQRRLEDTIVPIIEMALNKTGVRNIILSGGVVANVKLNQRIFNIQGVEIIFIHPCMSDCGTALGAALWVANERRKISSQKFKNLFLGYEITNREIEIELNRHGLKFSREKNIYKKVAELLKYKKVIARVTGKMEYGPRALGNRSILYHCKDTEINEWLNHRLKRTEFMPFAPIVMAEHAALCFKKYKGAEYTAEFMTITFECTNWMKENCPAVVHVDGTARPQLVIKDNNPELYSILEEYYNLTGIPVLINTSYNIHDEPIVRTEADAIRIFKITCLDYLAIGDYLVSAEDNNLSTDRINN